MKKLLCLLLLLCILLAACSSNGEPVTESSTPVETTVATEPPTITVIPGAMVKQLDDVSVYTPAKGKRHPLEGLPDFVYSTDWEGSYEGSKAGRYGLNTHVFSGTDAAAFITYLQALEADGWVQYSNNIIEGTNLFATYTKGTGSVYCYYINAKSRVYIITSPNQNLEAREQDNVYTPVCPTLLTQVKLLCRQYHGGMSYLLRLSDGRFVIIDGGFNEANQYHAKQLYQLMAEQNVLDRITVAAWIITHPHRDHLGTAADFFKCYTKDDLHIEQMIFNFPTEEDGAQADVDLTRTHSSSLPAFMHNLETYWPELTITVCHTGQEYYFADAKLEFLHTLEDYYPQSILSLSSNLVNGATAVFSLEVAGQKTMFLGDCALDESNDLTTMWGHYLKSDIMQAAHHAQRGATMELYDKIAPSVVMVPMSTRFLGKYILQNDASLWIWENHAECVKEVMISGFVQRVLHLPYAPSENTEYFSNATTDPWGNYFDIEIEDVPPEFWDPEFMDQEIYE